MNFSKSRKGQSEQLSLAPILTSVVAMLVLAGILLPIHGFGSTRNLEKKLMAPDIALFTESVEAVFPTVNLVVDYGLLKGFGARVDSRQVMVYEKSIEDSARFYFSQDPNYLLGYRDFAPNTTSKLRAVKVGHAISLLGDVDKVPSLVAPYCDKAKTAQTLKVQINKNVDISQGVGTVVSGDVAVTARARLSDEVQVRVFVNQNPESAYFACRIVEEVQNEMPLAGFAIIPVNGDLLAHDDPRFAVAQTGGVAVFVDVSGPSVQVKAVRGIASGVTDFV